MTKQSTGAIVSLLEPGSDAGQPLYRRLYSVVRNAILGGDLPPGTRLPSTRLLASDLGVSRNTVMNAFEQLRAEGYLDCETGAGSFVAKQLPATLLQLRPKSRPAPKANGPSRVKLGRRGQAMMAARTPMTPAGAAAAFVPGVPDLTAFPYEQWRVCMNHASRLLDANTLNYGPSEGFLPLRKALASYAAVARGVRCEPEQIIMVSGVQQGLDLIARLLTDPGDPVWLEDPGHLGARSVFIAAQNKPIPVPVDAEGLDVDEALRRCQNARLAYVTPSHQSPTGAVLSLQRRLQLLEWAQETGAWIIEDDYDSEFRYQGRPLAALQGLAEGARVLYLGTLSKVLAPGLRLAYIIVPEDLVDVFAAGRRMLDTHSPVPLQIALARFIEQGYFTAHIRRMRELYAQRQAILLEAARHSLSDWLRFDCPASGMHLVGYLNCGDDKTLSQEASQSGIRVPPLSQYYLGQPVNGLLFGYACVPSDCIAPTVKRLAAVFAATTNKSVTSA